TRKVKAPCEDPCTHPTPPSLEEGRGEMPHKKKGAGMVAPDQGQLREADLAPSDQRKNNARRAGAEAGSTCDSKSSAWDGEVVSKALKRKRGEGSAPNALAPMLDMPARVRAHDAYFNALLNMIPPEFVLPHEAAGDEVYNSKFMKNKKNAAPVQVRKEESKKNKRARYDASHSKTVLKLQQEATAAAEAVASDDADDGVDGGGRGGSGGGG
ncbi:unnamed protein product, partial [Phaeothamnion confervicola]